MNACPPHMRALSAYLRHEKNENGPKNTLVTKGWLSPVCTPKSTPSPPPLRTDAHYFLTHRNTQSAQPSMESTTFRRARTTQILRKGPLPLNGLFPLFPYPRTTHIPCNCPSNQQHPARPSFRILQNQQRNQHTNELPGPSHPRTGECLNLPLYAKDEPSSSSPKHLNPTLHRPCQSQSQSGRC